MVREFDENSTALKMRDIIAALVAKQIDILRPKYRYAKVVSFDRPTYKCVVRMVGDTTDVTVNMGSIQPSAVDQVVRVAGMGIDKFIDDVIGEPHVFGVRARLSAGNDLTLSSTLHAFQIGPDTGANLRMDPNEIEAVNNGANALLALNNDGGNVDIGDASSLVRIRGNLQVDLTAIAAGVNLNTLVTSGLWYQNVTANATLALNYPKVIAGYLEVFAPVGGTQFVMQRYTTYHPADRRVYVRTNYNGTWGAWAENVDKSVGGVMAWADMPKNYAAGADLSNATLAAGAFVDVTITLPAGRFSAAPYITLTTTAVRVTTGINSVSATSMSVRMGNWTTTASGVYNIHWHAIEGG